jgi:glycosyltransferase involved in cell wall biosynthesis
MRPDILLVGDAASVHVRRLATALRGRDLDVEIATFEGDAIDSVPSHRLSSLPVTADRRYLLAVAPLARVLRARRPRVVNAHYLTSFGVMSALALAAAFPFAPRPPLVQSPWGDDLLVTPGGSMLHRQLARFALRSARLVTGDSKDLEAAARRFAPELAWHSFIFGPPAQLLAASADQQHVILSARNLLPDMRVDLIIEAFRQASASPKLNGWKLVIAGAGPEGGALRQRVDSLPNVEFAGMLSQAELHELMLRSSVAVSVPVSDATSATLLETLAARMVPVVNDLPANREWVDDSVGVVIRRDPTTTELANAMIRAASMTVQPMQLMKRVAPVLWEAQVDQFVRRIRELSPGAPSRPAE